MEQNIDLMVSALETGTRLDAFVSRHLFISRSRAVRSIEQGRVTVDGSAQKPSFRLRAGMRVLGSWVEEGQGASPQAWERDLDILYEDAWIVVVNKPPGLVVHPGAGRAAGTLVNALLARYPEIGKVGDPGRPGIVHRLDRLTSGVMVVARNVYSHAALSAAFKAHEHTRVYLAVCYGHMPQRQGTIEAPMQRNPGHRTRMTSRTGTGRAAITHWEVLREWHQFTLLRLRLQTGRTHQIRVHLSDMGHPVAGDPVYGGRRRAQTIEVRRLRMQVKNLGRQMLHAEALGIRHPETGAYREFRCEMPQDMRAFVALLDEVEETSRAGRETEDSGRELSPGRTP